MEGCQAIPQSYGPHERLLALDVPTSAVPRGLKPHYQNTRAAILAECQGLAEQIGCEVRTLETPSGGHISYCWPMRGFDWELLDPPVSGSLSGLLQQLRDLTEHREYTIGRPASQVRRSA